MDTRQTLGEIVTEHPAALPVFLRHHLDFCCGGTQTLDVACEAAAAELDPSSVLEEIRAAEERSIEAPTDWRERPLGELIEHVLTRFHEPLRAELPAIVTAAQTVERVHSGSPACPRGLSAHLEVVSADVESHLAKEEDILFPLIVADRGPEAGMPIQVMTSEHDDHGRSLARTRELTDDLTLPPDACPTWTGLYRSLEKLEAELMEHIHLENNVLFPRALIRH